MVFQEGKGAVRFYDCITEFIFIEDEPRRSDIIFVPGGGYPEAAERAAELYHAGYAPYVMPSGKYSILDGRFVRSETGISGEQQNAGAYETECDYLCAILRRCGVPESAVLREDQATYTYENAIYSRRRTEELGLEVRRAILCCQAFHARRCLMYYQEQFPDTEFLVCPVVTKGIGRETWHRTRQGIDRVLGEVERCGGQFHEIMYEKLCQEDGSSGGDKPGLR